jgi:uncharacterized membrane protein
MSSLAVAQSDAVGRRLAISAPTVVGGLTVVAFVLRLLLVRDSLLGDELILYDIVHDRSLGDILQIVHDTEKTPPLGFVLAWASAHIGDPTLWIRLPSLLAGTALVPVTYLLGRETVGTAAGIVAAAVVTLQPYSIFYATEARAYALVALLAALSTVALLRALQTNRRAWWVVYGLAVVAATYTHYVAIFVLVAQTAWAFWVHRERLRELLVVHGLILLAYLPWLPSLVVQLRHSGDEAGRIAVLAPPSLEYFAQINAQMTVGQPFVSLRAVPGRIPEIVIGLTVAAALAMAAVRLFRGARPSARGVLVILLAVATPLGIAALSLRPDASWMLPRNLIASLPAVTVVIGWLLVSLPRRPAIAAVAVVLLSLAVGTVRALDHSNRRTQYRAAAQVIDERAKPGDPIIQHYFFSGQGALGRVLAINLDRPRPVFLAESGEEDAGWERARDTGRAFVVLPMPGDFKKREHLDRFDGPGDSFELRFERRFAGLEDVLVGEYVIRDR